MILVEDSNVCVGLSRSFISVTCDVGLPRLPVQILKTHPSSLLPYPTLVDRVIESDMVKLGISAIDKYKAACCLKGMKQFDQSMSHWDRYFDLSAQYSQGKPECVCWSKLL